jgi:hypothetical protein
MKDETDVLKHKLQYIRDLLDSLETLLTIYRNNDKKKRPLLPKGNRG